MNLPALFFFFASAALGGVILTGSQLDLLGLEPAETPKASIVVKTEEVAKTLRTAPPASVTHNSQAAQAPQGQGTSKVQRMAETKKPQAQSTLGPVAPRKPSGIYPNPKAFIPAGVKIVAAS